MIKKIFLVVLIALMSYLGREFYQEYMRLHPYYGQFLAPDARATNWQILLLGVICSLVPVGYLTMTKKHGFRMTMISLWAGLWLFFISYIGSKGGLMGGAVFKSLINTGFVRGLAVLFCTQLIAFGQRFEHRRLKLHETSAVVRFLLFFGMGLVGFLVIEYILLLLNIAFPIVNWVLFLSLCWLIRKQRVSLHELWNDLTMQLWNDFSGSFFNTRIGKAVIGLPILFFAWTMFTIGSPLRSWITLIIGGGLVGNWLYHAITKGDRQIDEITSASGTTQILLFILLLISVWYLYNGFILAYIPYPTAWDANHAYMFSPRMYALHNGYYRNEISMRGFGSIWLSYITYWFSLFSPTQGFLGISPDTIAIEMNFLSGLYVLIFGVGLVRVLADLIRHYYTDAMSSRNQRIVMMGWFLILLWITSGMGAFLVFIDNKTDMGVLAMLILAILSGFFFLRYLADHHEGGEKNLATVGKRLLLSSVFFAVATLTKPTAMFDVLNFGLLLRGGWFGVLGLIGAGIAVFGMLTVMGLPGVESYFSSSLWKRLVPVGGLGVLTDLLLTGKHKLMKYGKYLVIWSAGFIVVLSVLKLGYYIPDTIFYGNKGGVIERVKRILLVQAPAPHEKLLAQETPGLPTPAACSLQTEGLPDTAALYTGLTDAGNDSYNEDVGRYIGYGWKGGTTDQNKGIAPFRDPRWASMFKVGCTGFSPFFLDTHDAVVLCNSEADWRSFDATRVDTVLAKLRPDGKAHEFLQKIREGIGTASPTELGVTYAQPLQFLDNIMQGDTIKVMLDQGGSRIVFVPYKYLNFFNITFNRSLQNLSSYYTDIGITRLLLLFITIVGLIYGIIRQERFLLTMHIVTLFGWILWLIIGGGILRYAIGIIVWTILSFLVFIYSLSRHQDTRQKTFFVLFLIIFLGRGIKQLELNMIRISTQGGGGAFLRYKTNNGIVQTLDFSQQGQIVPINKATGSFGYDEVFDMQFPHYKKFLKLINERGPDDGALIAGTYARYFVDNQTHVMTDQFLTEVAKRSSDNNICRAYLRLKDKKLKYLVIDPNIGTVVQGAGNKSLFERFFGRLNPVDASIEKHGTFTMLAALAQAGYVHYVASNNIGAKYAFTMPDNVFGGLTGSQITVMRAKMAIARFFPQEQQLVQAIMSIADQRVKNGSFITDVADIMGLTLSDDLISKVASGQMIDPAMLSEDEKKAVAQFFQFRQLANTNPAQYTQTLQAMIMNSVNAGNQVVVLEVVK